MDGSEVFKFAVKAMSLATLKVLEDLGMTVENLDYIFPHQANIRIIETSARALEVEIDKFYINIDKYGNTSSASIIIAFDEYLEELDDKENKTVLLVAFGGGFTWGCALLTL